MERAGRRVDGELREERAERESWTSLLQSLTKEALRLPGRRGSLGESG